MTVSYNLDVSSTSLVAFLKLQLRWRGSIWKSVLMELFLFSVLFFVITFIYRSEWILSDQQRKFWDDFSALFDEKLDYIPLTFMLGFFVTIIVGRWNDIFKNIGWIDNTALCLSTYLRGSDEKSRMYRRNVIRYLVLTQTLLFRDISMQVRRRFPTMETIVAAGIMTQDELEKYASCNQKFSRYFIPIQWCYSVLFEARQCGKIQADLMLNEIIKNCALFRDGLAQLSNFDWVPIPLVYPQVVFLAVRSYFFLCLIARQSVLIDGSKPEHPSMILNMIPLFMTALQFIFILGWMKVAESLMNPLGEDDDDFECNFLLDRNLSVGLCIVDDNYNDFPPQTKDQFWSEVIPTLLYSHETANKPVNPQVGSAAVVDARPDAQGNEVIMMPHLDSIEENYPDGMLDPESNRLLPRGISVVSINRQNQYDSRTSLVSSRTKGMGIMDSIKRQFSRDGRKISITRPSRLGSSELSLANDTPVAELNNDVFDSMLGDLADETASRTASLLTPDPLPESLSRRSPVNEVLTSVPEEDEEHQRTLRGMPPELLKLQAEIHKAPEN